MQQYEALGVYPPGVIEPKGPIQNAPSGYHHNWLGLVLPYGEQNVVAKNIDRSVGVYHEKNRPLRGYRLHAAICPSMVWSAGEFCASSFAAVHHDREAAIDAGNAGAFFLNSRLKYDDLSDGLSYTLFLGEKVTDAWELGWLSGTRATLRNTGERLNARGYGNYGGLPRPGSKAFPRLPS